MSKRADLHRHLRVRYAELIREGRSPTRAFEKLLRQEVQIQQVYTRRTVKNIISGALE